LRANSIKHFCRFRVTCSPLDEIRGSGHNRSNLCDNSGEFPVSRPGEIFAEGCSGNIDVFAIDVCVAQNHRHGLVGAGSHDGWLVDFGASEPDGAPNSVYVYYLIDALGEIHALRLVYLVASELC
jgi:hypothetical protein